jgi:hypothetical protein
LIRIIRGIHKEIHTKETQKKNPPHTTSQPLNSHLNQGTIQAIHTNTTKKRDYNNKTDYATQPNILPLLGVPTILQPPHNLSPTQPNPYPLASTYKKVGKGKGTVLSGFAEFTFFHTFADEPMDESAFAVHHVEFSIETVPCFSDGGGIGTGVSYSTGGMYSIVIDRSVLA